MKQSLRAIAAFGVLGLASLGAHAADGTITFNGMVTAQTCTINGNGSGSNDFTVTLPTVSASTLAAAGDTAGRTPFNIALTNCTPASGNVHTFFEQGPTIDATTGDLILANGGATNVQLHLQNSDLSDIALNGDDGTQNSLSVAISSAGAATLPYYVEYKATGAATPGAADSSVMYTMSYQ
ncbi:fimbrial protein [Paraburkholderia antibiotica]|uniref:Type 1 fimbrial protein n=1 Tax=Paraburkholderia antibiotica TaxID=2728839 RepID=A0A7X9ZZY0_9BURK|nr:fimbrial protein [Paraburkholderia antibiotica]NML33940.1 type 1 fimbrial protein [Paraburkholderia antibiotica]